MCHVVLLLWPCVGRHDTDIVVLTVCRLARYFINRYFMFIPATCVYPSVCDGLLGIC